MKNKTARIITALAVASSIFITPSAQASAYPERCRTIVKQGTFYTSCWSGHYAITQHAAGRRITTWYHRMDPTFKVTCVGRITRAAQPVALCPRPQMHTFGL